MFESFVIILVVLCAYVCVVVGTCQMVIELSSGKFWGFAWFFLAILLSVLVVVIE